jgi:23S rRNA (cytosine1962-C5)-methyltransferase
MSSPDTSLPTALLRPGEADRVVAGHPWIYASSVLRLTREVADGDPVQVKDHRQRFLGVGFYNSRSKLQVRVLSRERESLDAGFFDRRIGEALEVRQRHLPGATSYRVVNAESDSLSGLIVDRYQDVLVLQTSSLGMDRRKPLIVEALQRRFLPRAIVERNDSAGRRFEGLPEVHGLLAGDLTGPVEVDLNGLRFRIDLLGGHKTGLYLDQQVNYARVGELLARRPGARVLDAFCFLGGFGLQAAKAGAANVHLLDQSEEAIAAAKAHAEANRLAEQCTFEVVNVFDWLKARTSHGPHERPIALFDAIILDPPSFTRTRAAVNDALRGYKEIHLRALKLLKPGGLLATFCCSHHVDAVTFQDSILAAAFDARRLLRRVATFQQSPDHPILPAIPETEYLKGYAFEVVG